MYTEFFQRAALPPDALQGAYDTRLVVLSFLVAIVASYIALDLTGRLRDHNNTPKDNWLWLLGGSIAMGGIHYGKTHRHKLRRNEPDRLNHPRLRRTRRQLLRVDDGDRIRPHIRDIQPAAIGIQLEAHLA